MFYKIIFIILATLLLSPAIIPVFSFAYANETRVCGIDNKTYASQSFADRNNIFISYDFPCQFPASENGLYERVEKIELTGKLLNIFEKINYRQLFIQSNRDKQEYLIIQNNIQNKKINEFFPGDQINIIGDKNKNTEVILASIVNNLSTKKDYTITNCIFNSFNESTIYCQNNSKNEYINFDENTRFVSGFINPATAVDLKPGDKIRIRINATGVAELLLVTKRGNINYFKNNIFEANAKLIKVGNDYSNFDILINNNIDSLEKFNDQKEIKINLALTNKTRLIKKYFGKLNAEDFSVNDDLYIVARAKDDGTYEAITIKNNSVWK